MNPESLSSKLLADQKVTEAQLQQAQTMRDATGGDLGELLVKLGFVDAETLANYKSKVDGIELVDIDGMILPDTLVNSIPRDVIEKHRVIPIAKGQGTITLAMSDAENIAAIEDVQFATGMMVNSVRASKEQITKAIIRYYDEMDTKTDDDDDDAAVGVAADTGEVDLVAGATGEISLDGVVDWSDARYVRALVALLFEKGIITEAELRDRANKIDAGESEAN